VTRLGVDIGGTHTDAILVDDDGVIWRGKALTTHEDYSEGIIASAQNIADRMGIDLRDVLADVTQFVNGTTVATNVVAELHGARVGLLTTKGFEYTLFIARMPRGRTLDLHQQLPLPEIVPIDRIRGISERIDKSGAVVIPLDEEEVRAAAIDLVENHGVEEIAICLLWSFLTPAHEQQARAAIEGLGLGVQTTLSSDLMPVVREYERMVPTALNGYVGPRTRTYLDTITNRADEVNLDAELLVMNARGGFAGVAEARERPVNLISSGPAAGVMGARFFGETLGLENVVCADVGGTSFDVATLPGLRAPVEHRIAIGPFATAMSAIGVDSIGTGGGSIAWIDARGVLNVGPRSAGSMPGPACYGRGGEQPTVTDALVTLGLIQPERYLGGRVLIDASLAANAIERNLCAAMAMSVNDVAAAIVRIALTQCAGRLALSTVERGYDPREFTMFVYGGLGAILCPLIAQDVGVRRAVIPESAAQFSAFGLLTVDRQVELTVTRPWILPESPELVEQRFAELAEQGRRELAEEGFVENVTIERSGDFSFLGQHSEFHMQIPDGDIDERAAAAIAEQFEDYYEELHGPGTAWTGVPVQMVNTRVKVSGTVQKPTLKAHDDGGEDTSSARLDTREMYVLGRDERGEVPRYEWTKLQTGMRLAGPALIAGDDTTTYVPPDAEMRVDAYRNLVIDFQPAGELDRSLNGGERTA
jgi:N-methylhydantoinase A